MCGIYTPTQRSLSLFRVLLEIFHDAGPDLFFDSARVLFFAFFPSFFSSGSIPSLYVYSCLFDRTSFSSHFFLRACSAGRKCFLSRSWTLYKVYTYGGYEVSCIMDYSVGVRAELFALDIGSVAFKDTSLEYRAMHLSKPRT